MPIDARTLLETHGRLVDSDLRAIRARFPFAPFRLLDAIDYSLLAGGKRLRPALVLETCHACGGDPATNRSARAAAVAMELIHTFSLVHDDLPAMDDDDLRRGLPTNHKVFGEAMAILAGDAMTTIAFGVLASDAEPSLAPLLIAELAEQSGPAGMIGGQVLDIDGENRRLTFDELQQVHRYKTGALLVASCKMGWIAAAENSDNAGGRPVAPRAALSLPETAARQAWVVAYARHLGLAFQIIDDVLDVTATREQMGKATGKDAGRGKNTYPGLLGLEESRLRADQELAAAMDALTPIGDRAAGLRALANFVVRREK